ncbi:spore coat protein CotJB [Melghirimyces profundicolus]|uniref:spore coat protein CotJB n=1 Tax=Melghirimyces profundicolus TaxID=1242148 RepID=UPI000D35108C|nr:spore coat protein CotJB [Melghirimyces profundicolus]
MKQDYYRLLGELQTVDFFLSELNLHLATHPQDHRAQAQRKEYHRIRQDLNREYEHCIRLMHATQEQLTMRKARKK